MQVKVVWAVREKPTEDATYIHEFNLFYFSLVESDIPPSDKAVPAVWVRFSESSQIETLQFHCPNARLGPSHSFTEGLVLTENVEEAEALCQKLAQIFLDAEMKEVFDEDTMEDY